MNILLSLANMFFTYMFGITFIPVNLFLMIAYNSLSPLFISILYYFIYTYGLMGTFLIYSLNIFMLLSAIGAYVLIPLYCQNNNLLLNMTGLPISIQPNIMNLKKLYIDTRRRVLCYDFFEKLGIISLLNCINNRVSNMNDLFVKKLEKLFDIKTTNKKQNDNKKIQDLQKKLMMHFK